MSSFNCKFCRTFIEDGPDGYVTGCPHHAVALKYLKVGDVFKHQDFARFLYLILEKYRPIPESLCVTARCQRNDGKIQYFPTYLEMFPWSQEEFLKAEKRAERNTWRKIDREKKLKQGE